MLINADYKKNEQYDLDFYPDVSLLKQETAALEELSRQMFLEVVDLHNQQVC